MRLANAGLFLEWVLAQVDQPYLWGGCGSEMWTPGGIVRSPYPGWDCIHLVTDGLLHAGGEDLRWQWNTDTAWRELRPVATPKPGDVAFWAARVPRDQDDVEHIEIVVGPGQKVGTYRTIGAAGGNHLTTTLAMAKSQNACVRYRDSHIGRPYFAGFRALPLTQGA